jgi:ABC-2 type transport system permease protein
MRTIVTIIQKEFRQIFRDRTMLPIILIMPFVQLIVLVYAATFEMKSIHLAVLDRDRSAVSAEFISRFEGSPFFQVHGFTFSEAEAEDLINQGKADLILYIPTNFERDLRMGNPVPVQLRIDAINSTAAGLTNAYASQVIARFNQDFNRENRSVLHRIQRDVIQIEPSYWYNPELDYKIYMVPGILVILITIIGAFLAALNIVREKEMGTIEQINVTPIKKYQFILGKLLPFWIIAMLELAFGLTLGKILFGVPFVGSLSLLFMFAGVYLLVALGLGLLVSTLASTQQQVMFIIFFFLLTFILMSGIFTPVESMPEWGRWVNTVNPFAYFMKVIRMVLLKGSTFTDISNPLYALLVYATIILSLAVWRYRKAT